MTPTTSTTEIKFADVLVELEVLSYYDRPLLVLYREQGNGQQWIAAWIDEDQDTVKWHMIAITSADLEKLLAKDPDHAITLRQAMERSAAIYRCEANTFDYGTVTRGRLCTSIEEEFKPGDGSYVQMEAYTTWAARQKEKDTGAVPLNFTEPFQPASPDEPETVPGSHLDWPELTTVPSQLMDDDACPWKKTGFL